MKKITVRKLVMIFLVAVIVFCAYNLIVIYMGYQEGNQVYQEARLQFLAEPDQNKEENESEVKVSVGKEKEIPLNKRIDFNKLKKANEDIVGWIYVPDTNIDYPLLMSRKSNDDYIYTTYEKKYSAFGSIFIDYRNNQDFSDNNTLIYGHNMKNKAMFGDLMQYVKEDFADEHKVIKILTEQGVDLYEVYSAYKTLANSESYNFKFENEKEFESFIEITNNNSLIDTGIKAGKTDRIITLSTCTDTGRTLNRFVVHAMYMGKEE